jgi:hypothetical protein
MESIITHVTSSVLSAAFLIVAVLALSLALVQASSPKLRPVRGTYRRAVRSAKR